MLYLIERTSSLEIERDNASLPKRTLPVEIIALIIDEAARPIMRGPLIPLDSTSLQPLVAAKPSFESIRGLSGTNRWIRHRTLSRWFSTMVIRKEDDWNMAARLHISTHILLFHGTMFIIAPAFGTPLLGYTITRYFSHFLLLSEPFTSNASLFGRGEAGPANNPLFDNYRELRVLSAALTESVADDVFMRFPNLHTVIIDAHNDFVPRAPTPANISQSIGHYRLVAPQLPSTLRRLWLTNAHGPDVRVIQNACIQCPQLEDLRIERCTLFSPRLLPDPVESAYSTSADSYDESHKCHFWSNFPSDHDAYFASIGAPDYASSLADELRPLKHLKRLHMGLYLTPTEAITVHRTQHSNTCIHGSIWTPICQSCSDEFGATTQEAEESATAVLGYQISSLEEISWSSFHSINKAGRSLFKIKREPNGEIICQRQTDNLADWN
ncbi:hypothetical protein RHS04_02952 [Rhizoctonia solani]|uniref:Uncharacterized protein n=1 Tax=Rhizoctonia solani TaxID=456999 RepID=A0A8H7IJ29_9AGAM|nr:hypothetical protein RHS04_02952 [Rhizoctonia solani]KAF8760002.1 hypothetical protein RHS01_01427 [Rhizoctonia solani]